MSIREKLQGEILPSEWKMLLMHQRRGALFMVDPSLDLLDVATAIAEDRRAEVEAWIAGGLLKAPTESQVSSWSHEEGPCFVSVIVQPFVLAQRAE